MALVGYPGLRRHQEEHDRLMAQIAELLLRLRNADAPAVAETETLLKSAFMQHLSGPDSEFRRFLAEQRGRKLSP